MTSFSVACALRRRADRASASLLLMLNGRVAGISGIFAGAISGTTAGASELRLWFLLACCGRVALRALVPEYFTACLARRQSVVAGLLVGTGRGWGRLHQRSRRVRVSRLSTRSIVATAVFIAAT